MSRQPDDWTESEANEAQMSNRINELESLLVLIRSDLNMRAETDHDGETFVNLSDGIWQQLNKAINDK